MLDRRLAPRSLSEHYRGLRFAHLLQLRGPVLADHLVFNTILEHNAAPTT